MNKQQVQFSLLPSDQEWWTNADTNRAIEFTHALAAFPAIQNVADHVSWDVMCEMLVKLMVLTRKADAVATDDAINHAEQEENPDGPV